MPKGETSGLINKRERLNNLQKAEVLKLQHVKDKSFIGEKFGISEKYVGEIFRKREKILLDVARNPEGKSAKQPMFELLEQSVLLSIAEMRSNSLPVYASSPHHKDLASPVCAPCRRLEQEGGNQGCRGRVASEPDGCRSFCEGVVEGHFTADHPELLVEGGLFARGCCGLAPPRNSRR